MSKANLTWKCLGDLISFQLKINSTSKVVSINEWGLYDIATACGNGSVACLLGFIEDGIAKKTDNHAIVLEQNSIAKLDNVLLKQIGLPPAAPFRLCIKGQGILTSPSFKFIFHLAKQDGRPLLGIKRKGIFINVGSDNYTLLDPLFSLIEGMEAFNKTPPKELDSRFMQWAELKELLPTEAIVDESLKSMNIVRADSFSLDIDDQFNINPILIHRSARGENNFSSDEPFTPGIEFLPNTTLKEFQKRFSVTSSVKNRYSVGSNWFVVLPEPLVKALQEVKHFQSAPISERQAFIANPQSFLEQKLGNKIDVKTLNSLFEETASFLSDRIKTLGEWHPKACAYIMPNGNDWFPPEETLLAIPVDKKIYKVMIKDIPDLAEEMGQALKEGKQGVIYQDQKIPVTPDAVIAISRINQLETSSPVDNDSGVQSRNNAPEKKLVPILLDNIDDLEYIKNSKKRRGVPGGIPGVLKMVSLFPHQSKGLLWLQEHWASGSTGALLADDMGLGKTLQTLAFLAWVQEQYDSGVCNRKPLLIVAPTGLLRNWQDEEKLHLSMPGLGKVFKAFGKELSTLNNHSHNQRNKVIKQCDWVLTTYETLRDKINFFLTIDWGVIVFDEAQKIKNPSSRMTEMAKSVKGDFVLTLTGTPVENKLADLWSIIDTSIPGFLGSLKHFYQTYEKPLIENPNIINELKDKLIKTPTIPCMLRRMKEDHLDGLPQKKEHIIEVDMSDEQSIAYTNVLTKASTLTGANNQKLQFLNDLRKISLLACDIGGDGLTDELVHKSARFNALIKILDRVQVLGEKALVFVEFISIQDALISYLQKRYQLTEPPMRISGAVNGDRRKELVDKFQASKQGKFDVMILSPKAAGVGLTLTAANHVIHLTRWWNPAVEAQCTDRVFRIGQTKEVHVYFPLAIYPPLQEKSFDLNLHQMLENKKSLSNSVLSPSIASDEDMSRLFESTVG